MRDLHIILAKIENLQSNKVLTNHLEDAFIVINIKNNNLLHLYTENKESLKSLHYTYYSLLEDQIIRESEYNRGVFINPTRVPRIKIDIKKDFEFIRINTIDEINTYSQLYNIDYLNGYDKVHYISQLLPKQFEDNYLAEKTIQKIEDTLSGILKSNLENHLTYSDIIDDLIQEFQVGHIGNIKYIEDTRLDNILKFRHFLDCLNGESVLTKYYGDMRITKQGVHLLGLCRITMKVTSKTLDIKEQYKALQEKIYRETGMNNII